MDTKEVMPVQLFAAYQEMFRLAYEQSLKYKTAIVVREWMDQHGTTWAKTIVAIVGLANVKKEGLTEDSKDFIRAFNTWTIPADYKDDYYDYAIPADQYNQIVDCMRNPRKYDNAEYTLMYDGSKEEKLKFGSFYYYTDYKDELDRLGPDGVQEEIAKHKEVTQGITDMVNYLLGE